ncbi:MAG TPA: DNA repair protein RecN [Saprospiraceae bacterium]|jgi:DNA repair protein RecN (Recombination protein N)|nr:DNA repair protein RecN [Saprospiraceae bacterium]MBX7179499.1 DNA repair protein RecN [Saprospiraceae bacterium]MCB0590431.1 DNA repair protein RecN [Saprospiraceae bacterium]MCO5282650.1 DNA repair protein RecN [Saprospiraceae bacterium]MCO6469352.1 DNA repair protein RecN [Saprospiraceae bacterium]
MLQRIRVRNYAIIDEVSIEFDPHFNIITGETGAGKSILLGALGLILGNRADSKTFFNTEEKCIVEAEFSIGSYSLHPWFEANDLDYEDLTLIRREIQPAGKNRTFINDTPVTLQQLQEFTQQLIDIHQQFSLYDIQKPAYQLMLFDAYSGNKVLMGQYSELYRKYIALGRTLKELQEERQKSLREADYLAFQLEELNSVDFVNMDQDALEEELNMIDHAGTIKSTAGAAYVALYDDDNNIISAIEDILNSFGPITAVSPRIKEVVDRLQSSRIELRELAEDINRLAESTEIDEERAAEIRESLDQLYKLQSKHQVGDIAGLVALKEEIDGKLNNYSKVDDDIVRIEQEMSHHEEVLNRMAESLSESRKSHIPDFIDTLKGLLSDLGMPHATFVIEMEPSTALTPSGKDAIRFLFAANKGGQPAAIKDVASGGEISRLTLSIKSMVAAAIPLPSLIFDEIDTGLGGEIALKMAEIMREMAREHQLIAITHSPQLASKADKHFFVYKEIEDNNTFTRIKELSLDERIENIAIMLSTKPPTKAAVENARELLERK